ncbi:hypothetical protein Gotur_021796 [Gossypium turneri]
MSLDSTMDKVNELFNSHRDKLLERNDPLEAMMMALKEETMATTRALSTRIEELEGELALCRAAVGKGVSSAALSNEDVPKPKEFVRIRSACNVDNFLWRMENYFCAKGIMDDAVKVNTRIYRGRSSGKVARDNTIGHNGGVCSRVQGTHTLSFRGDRKRGITCFSEWIEAVGQTGGGTKRCPKGVGSHDGS